MIVVSVFSQAGEVDDLGWHLKVKVTTASGVMGQGFGDQLSPISNCSLLELWCLCLAGCLAAKQEDPIWLLLFFFFLQPHLRHREVPWARGQTGAGAVACATVTATLDLRRVCNLHLGL